MNAPIQDVRQVLSRAMIGIHSMWNEHFGIGIVEYMAAGVIPVAHNSGGPKLDIIIAEDSAQPRCGYLAETTEEYVEAIRMVLQQDKKTRLRSQQCARQRAVDRFDEKRFETGFLLALHRLVPPSSL